MKFRPAVAWVRNRTGHSVDWLAWIAWIATVLCMLGLIVTLAGSAMGVLLFLGAWGAVVTARADRCLLLIFRSPEPWLIAAFALLSVLWSQPPTETLRTSAELILTVGVASLTAGFQRPREFVFAMSVSLAGRSVMRPTPLGPSD